jgi:hypothetical protein
MKKTFLTILIVLLLVVSGCSGEPGDATAPRVNATETEPPVAPTGDTGPEHVTRATEKESRLTTGTLILTVNEAPVTWPEFHFWLNYIAKYYKSTLGAGEITDWEVDQNGMPLAQFFLATAVGYASKDRAIEAKAEELGIGLSGQDLAEIEEKRASNIRIYGSELEYRRIVSSMYMSEEVFNYLTRIDYLGNYLFEHFYGANGEDFSDREVSAYVRENDLMCAKYIFRSNRDADGNPLGEDVRVENDRLLKDIMVRLDTSETPRQLFTELMMEHSEDETASRYPNGRLIAPGGKGGAFETALRKLKENEYSNVVMDDEGSYIILRMPISPGMSVDTSGNTLRYRAAYEWFKKQVEGWSEKMKVDYHDAYYNIDVETLL